MSGHGQREFGPVGPSRRLRRDFMRNGASVVLLILGMCAGTAGCMDIIDPSPSPETRRTAGATLEVHAIANAVEMYNIKHRHLPDSLDQLVPNDIRVIHKDP